MSLFARIRQAVRTEESLRFAPSIVRPYGPDIDGCCRLAK